jgi:hypothetical protein
MKRVKIIFILILIFNFFSITFIAAQEVKTYEEFKKVEYFTTVEVNIKGDKAKDINLDRDELSFYALHQFKDIFSTKMKYPYRLRAISVNTSISNKISYGRLTFLIWIIGNDYPISYFVQAKAGNHVSYFWKREVLEKGLKEEIPDEINKIIKQFIQELAHDYFTVKSKE